MSDFTPQPPAPPPTSSRLGFVLRIVAGCVVVAVVVGIGLVARGLGDDGLTLPDRVAGFEADSGGRPHEERRAAFDYNSARFSDAFDGADAVTAAYAGEDDQQLVVTAVRAEAGPPLPFYFDDPELTGTPHAQSELVEKGDVTCLLNRSDPSKSTAAAIVCQRTGGDLTVRVFSLTHPDLDDVVDATDEVWDELS